MDTTSALRPVLLRPTFWGVCCALAVVLSGIAVARAGTRDPFALENRADPEPPKVDGKKPAPKPGRLTTADLIDFAVSVTPRQARPGQTVKLTITGTPKPGFWTYPLTQGSPQQDAFLSSLEFKDTPGLKPLWPITESLGDFGVEKDLKIVLLKHKKKFTWSQDVLILPDAAPGPKTLYFTITLQVCNEKTCIPGTHELQAEIDVTKGAAVKLTSELEKRLRAKEPPMQVIEPPEGVGGFTGPGSSGLLGFLLAGVFWGAVSLVTPCVFPMIPITVSFFLKQSESKHHRPMTMALVYCLTIVVVLTIAAVALLSLFRELSTNPVMNIVIGALFIFFALSLFGMYDISLPSGLARFTSSREGQGGLVGTMFMALTFTIISFACVAPFLGGFGGTAASSNLTLLDRILGGLAFSITFALPFFVLALFPTLLKKMPKSGSWLNTVKVVMGFLELAAAIKFLRAGELVILSRPAFFTYDLCLGIYVALSLLCGLYLLGVFRLPHDSPSEHLGVPRLLFSMVFLSLAFYLVPGLFKVNVEGQTQRPAGAVFAWMDSFLLPDEQDSDLPWVGNLKKGLEQARAQNKLVFVDFTGVTCTNCSINERSVFPKPAVKKLLEQYVLVQLYTDKVPDKFYTPEEIAEFAGSTAQQRKDAVANLKFQRQQFNTEQLPLYVILEPLEDGQFKEVRRYAEGRINSVAAFTRFLMQPATTTAGAGTRAEARGK